MFSSYNTTFVVFTILVLLNLGNTVDDDGCSFTKSPGRIVNVTAGKSIKLEWILAVNLTKYPNPVFRISQPDNRNLYVVVIKTNNSIPDKSVLAQKPFSNRIKWTGNQNKLSFLFINVTRDLSLKYFIDLINCGPSVSETVELHVLELPTKPNISCSSGSVVSNKIMVKFRNNLHCSCLATGGFPSPNTYWETPAFDKINKLVLARNKIQKNQGGNYTCVASNMAGNETNWLEVEVQYLELQCLAKFKDNKPTFFSKLEANPEATCNKCKTPFTLSTTRTAVYSVTASNGYEHVVCNVSAVYVEYVRTCGDKVLSFNLTYYSFESNGTYRAIALLQYDEHVVRENNASVYKNGTLLPKSIDRLFKNPNVTKICKTGKNDATSSSNAGLIAGVTVGAAAVCIGVGGAIYWKIKK